MRDTLASNTAGNVFEQITKVADSLPPLSCFARDRDVQSRDRKQSVGSSWGSTNLTAAPTTLRTKASGTLARRPTPSTGVSSVPVERSFLRGGAREQPTLASTRGFAAADKFDSRLNRSNVTREQVGSRGTLSGAAGSGRAVLTPPQRGLGRNVRPAPQGSSQTGLSLPASMSTAGPSAAGPAAAPPQPSSLAVVTTSATCETCDACDGKHPTDRCPFFKGKARDKHPDAKRASEKKLLGHTSGPVEVLRRDAARVIRQPGDGSCLFHSLARMHATAAPLRARLRLHLCLCRRLCLRLRPAPRSPQWLP